jgi:hypothetical protein
MAVTKKKLSSYVPPKTVDELKGNPDVFIPVVEKNKNNYVLPLDDLLNKAEAGTKVYKTNISGTETDVDELKFILKSVDTVQIKADSTNLGSTVPLPSIAGDEGKVPVAYYRDGRGYFILEKYKDSRFPDSTSSNVDQTLVVNAQGQAEWVKNTAIKWVTNTNTYAQVNDWYTKGYTILRNDAGIINMAYAKNDDVIFFTQLNDNSNIHYGVSISQNYGWSVSNAHKHQLVKGGACSVTNNEAHDVILSLNSAVYTTFVSDELVIDYMSYHAGAFFATLKYTGELFITGTRHNWSLGGSQSPVDSLVNINETVVLTRDTRTNLGDAFDLSAQELSRTDYRIDWDLIMRFRQGPMDGGAYMSWYQPVHVKISRTSGSSPIIIAGV